MNRRAIDMISAAVLLMGLGYVVAVSARSLPGQEGDEPLLNLSLTMPSGGAAAIRWILLGATALGATVMLFSVARAARGQVFDAKRLRVLLYWIAAFVIAMQVRPPVESAEPEAASEIAAGPTKELLSPESLVAAEWMAGVLISAFAVALVLRVLMARSSGRARAVRGNDTAWPDAPSTGDLAPPLELRLADDPRSRIINAYAGFERGAKDAGVGRFVAETPRGHVRRVESHLELDHDDLSVLEDQYESVRFGDAAAGPTEAERAETAWQRIRGRLSS